MIRFVVSKRQESSLGRSCLVLTAAIGLSLLISILLLSIQIDTPLQAMVILFKGAFGNWWSVEDCLLKAVPIFLCAIGVAVAFRLKIWNIGAEGQFALGAIGATWIALAIPNQPWYLVLPAMLVMAGIAGGLWGAIPAQLKTRLGVNEIIVTLMLNYIAILILDYLVYGPWKDPRSFGFPMTAEFSPGAVVGKIGIGNLNWGLPLCAVVGCAIWIFFRFTRIGFEIQAAGENVRAAQYARIRYNRLVILVMVMSGFLAGLAGFLETSATVGRLQPTIMVGYGYTAIVVAWLARLNPLYIGIASFLLAGLRVGVEGLQLDLQVPAAFGQIMEGLILLTVLACSFFVQYNLRIKARHDP